MRFATRLYMAGLIGVLSLAVSGGSAKGQSVELPAVGAVAGASPSDSLLMGSSTLAGKVYSLHLHHLHTGESLDVVYRIGDTYIPEALAQLNHFLRDHRTDDASHYDVKEFDLLHSIMARLGKPNGIIDIVCGYRTPWSNAFLRHGSASSGVAEHSQHMEAKAIDIRVPGVQTAKLRDTAESFEAGGVGYYPVSQFVHVDVGPVRTWSFGESTRGKGRLRTAAVHRHGRARRAVIHHYGN
ncbi:DUF882 domain-containing protein [Granulicella aggregans]|uniref:DUF882 domain-containing protein n=1 Tax=Granulicella aggregans TaxID=474949 RepID=UPI0021DFCCD5|nr:DUF882 domain-containing protein [Granulicella aggregans]